MTEAEFLELRAIALTMTDAERLEHWNMRPSWNATCMSCSTAPHTHSPTMQRRWGLQSWRGSRARPGITAAPLDGNPATGFCPPTSRVLTL